MSRILMRLYILEEQAARRNTVKEILFCQAGRQGLSPVEAYLQEPVTTLFAL